MNRLSALFAFSLFLLAACSQAPEIPYLNRNTPEKPTVLLRGELHAKDIRSLFRDLNRNGRLDGLKPFFEKPSDADLEVFAGLVSRQIFQELDSPNGLMSALQAAVDKRAFRDWQNYLAPSARDAAYHDRAESLLAVASDPNFPALAKRDRNWLQPDWTARVQNAWTTSRGEYEETKPHPPAKEISAEMLFGDLRTLVLPPDSRAAVAERLGGLVDSRLFFPLARLATKLRGETGVAAFEGLGYGLAGLAGEAAAPYANRLDQTLVFLHSIDRGTDGLFNTVAASLRQETSALGIAAQSLRPLFAQVVNENLRVRLASKDKKFWKGLARASEDQPSASFAEFFQIARLAFSDLIGQERLKNTSDEFAFNLTLDFDAYALTRWAEGIATSNAAAWEALPEAGFAKAVWAQHTKDDGAPVICNDGDKLADSCAADFKALKEDRIAQEASLAMAHHGYGDFVYPFNGGDFPSLTAAAQAALEAINDARPYADPEPSVKLLAQQVLQPDLSGKSLLEHLESPNLLQSLQALLGGVGPEAWQTARYWLFNKLALDHLTPDTRNLLLGFYKKQPDLAKRVGDLLDGLPLLGRLDTGVDGLPSPFSFYHRLLRETDAAQKNAVGAALSYAGQARWLGATNGTANLPAVQAALADGSTVARFLHALAYLPADDADTFTHTLTEMFGSGGLRAHLDLLAGLLETQPRGVTAWLHTLNALSDAPEVPPALRAWAFRFVASPDFPLLVKFLRDHATRATSVQFVNELSTLSRNGELREAFNLLAYLRDDRMKEVGEHLKAWQATGEVDSLIATLQFLLVPLSESAAS